MAGDGKAYEEWAAPFFEALASDPLWKDKVRRPAASVQRSEIEGEHEEGLVRIERSASPVWRAGAECSEFRQCSNPACNAVQFGALPKFS